MPLWRDPGFGDPPAVLDVLLVHPNGVTAGAAADVARPYAVFDIHYGEPVAMVLAVVVIPDPAQVGPDLVHPFLRLRC